MRRAHGHEFDSDKIRRFKMRGARLLRGCFCLALTLSAASVAWPARAAEDLYLTDGRSFPGQLWFARAGSPERLIHRREVTVNPAFPRAAMKLGQVAVGPDGKVYFASGLDGYVIHLLDRRNEVVSFEFAGQVRDLACSAEEHTVYFSVVPTPQNGEPLADGKIYRRDTWAGQPSEAATIRQSQVGGNWWGAFTVRDGVFYLATLENPSRIIKLTTGGPEPFATADGYKIQGLASGRDGAFYFTDGGEKVYRTADFRTIEPVFQGSRPFTDVSLKSASEPPQP
jgi:hypothetical protein